MSRTVEDCKREIDELYSDTSVSQAEAIDRLEDIIEHVRTLIESLDPEA